MSDLEKVALPYHLDAVTQVIGTMALDYEDDMHERVERDPAEPLTGAIPAFRRGPGVRRFMD